jgi:uncharacterized membrane protein YadS
LVYVAQFGAPEALDAATITKLQRNMFMIAVIPMMSFITQKRRPNATVAAQMKAAMPFFVFGFLGMSLLRTLGDIGDQPFGFLTQEAWDGLITLATQTATLCLAVAMSAVGLGTSFSRLRGLGLRPLGVGLAAAGVVGLVSYGMVKLVGPLALS